MQHPHDTTSDFCTTRIAARELDTSEANVRKLTNTGRLPCVRTLGGVRLIRIEDVRRFDLPPTSDPQIA